VVHSGDESALGIDDLKALRMPLPAMAIHLGIGSDTFASQASAIIRSFDELLAEMAPCAVMTLGSSDADLACSLATRKRGVPLLRMGSGRRDANRALTSQTNAVLIERIADVHYTDSNESFYALYREGIRLDRVHSVGNLGREMLDLARISLPTDAGAGTRLAVTASPAQATEYGLITIDPSAGFSQPERLAKAVALLRQLGKEMPLLWLLNSEGLRTVTQFGHVGALASARITLITATGVEQALTLMRSAKCLISTDEGPWLEEAKLLGIAALALTEGFVFESVGARRAAEAQGQPLPPTDHRARLRARMAAGAANVQAPEYWDTGTATRIAAQLIAGFPKTDAEPQARRGAQPALAE
jgi:general secretion pathway protein A